MQIYVEKRERDIFHVSSTAKLYVSRLIFHKEKLALAMLTCFL